MARPTRSRRGWSRTSRAASADAIAAAISGSICAAALTYRAGSVSSQPDPPPGDAGEAPTVEASEPPDSFDDILRRVVQPAGDAPGDELAAGTELVGRFKIVRTLG